MTKKASAQESKNWVDYIQKSLAKYVGKQISVVENEIIRTYSSFRVSILNEYSLATADYQHNRIRVVINQQGEIVSIGVG